MMIINRVVKSLSHLTSTICGKAKLSRLNEKLTLKCLTIYGKRKYIKRTLQYTTKIQNKNRGRALYPISKAFDVV